MASFSRIALLAASLTAAACPRALAAGWPGGYSRLDRERPQRARTDYIILHTTEAPAASAYRKLMQNGEAHYLVERSGRVRKIIRRYKVACHAGRSMWNGRQHLDRYALGIEAEGYHHGTLTDAQYAALRRLLDELQRAYGIPDDRVLTHSMVAYGEANRWHRRPHRGRKRCGMLFARKSVRHRLGLYSAPRADPDVAAGRLAVGDVYLAQQLYGPAAVPKPSRKYAAGPATRPRAVAHKGRSSG
jgi:hypothetical protein